ncbi:MAG: proteasome accessory factor PafA2 family protein [Bifidobacteriaceae bacterium]|nr:proteasome accessory factor PafA2 family protein [Bifidobacteriaceae bacterium]
MRGVFGLETEYGITAAGLSAEEAARELFRPVVAWGRGTSVFTPAGARLYLDVGSHPEYATAECSRLAEMVAQERAGDQLMAVLAAAASRRAGVNIALIKNNTDSAGNAFGCHENYQVPRAGSAELAAKLIPFLVTRQLIAGAGKVQVDPRGARYVLSQRALHTSEALSSATTRSRPMINTRDEPHADGARYRRLHVIAGDSNMSAAAAGFKFGATNLLLRAATSGAALPALELDQPARAIREVAQGWQDAHPVALADGRLIRPAEVQWEYFEVARQAARDNEDQAVVNLWERALTAWDRLDFTGLETELDWLAKWRLIARYRQRTGAGLADPRVLRLELAYHQLDAQGGLRAKLEARGQLADGIGRKEIAAAVTEPPATTRGRLRGRFIAAARRAGREYTVDWVRLKLGQGETVALTDPLDNSDPAALALIAELEAEPAAGLASELDRLFAAAGVQADEA